MTQDFSNEILQELQALKKLRVLDLLDRGYSQGQIAIILEVGQATISRMFPGGVPRKKG